MENPQTFNEKIQWLKLYDSTPEKTFLADKYQVRNYIRQTIGEKYLVPLLGVYSKFDDIDFENLPDKFVLKCNHGSGMNVIVADKSAINKKNLKAKFDKWMRENFGFVKGLQLHYNYIPHKIIAEEYISPLTDYKFYCYNGKCMHILQNQKIIPKQNIVISIEILIVYRFLPKAQSSRLLCLIILRKCCH